MSKVDNSGSTANHGFMIQSGLRKPVSLCDVPLTCFCGAPLKTLPLATGDVLDHDSQGVQQ